MLRPNGPGGSGGAGGGGGGASCGGIGALPAALAGALCVAFVLSVMRARLVDRPPAGDAIFSSPLVSKAPALAAAGTSNLTDNRGAYVRVAFAHRPEWGAGASSAAAGVNDAPYVNVMYTKKGAYRSGDIHKCDQVNAIVAGSAALTTIENGAQRKKYLSAGESVVIPANIPHLFYFKADSIMTEYWVHRSNGSLCPYEAWYYRPFRDRIRAISR